MFSCSRICVEVDLDKGLQEAINLLMEGLNHLHIVYHEKVPLKCKVCHDYRHFEKFCLKISKNAAEKHLGEEWNHNGTRSIGRKETK